MVTHADLPTADGNLRPPDDPGGPPWRRGGASRLPGEWRWLVPITIAASTAAWLAGVLSGHLGGRVQVLLIITGAALTAVAVGLPLQQQRRSRETGIDAIVAAHEAQALMRLVLEDALDPFVHLITMLAEAHGQDKARLRGEAIQLAVATATQLARADRVRACYFVLDAGPPRQLVLERFAGRAGAPTNVFIDGTRAGTAALRLIESRRFMFIPDTEHERPSFWWDDTPHYRTFVAGPVATPQSVLGMLTLDALTPGELAEVDVPLIRLIADLLAVALRI